MQKAMRLTFIIIVSASLMMGQIAIPQVTSQTTDILGAHLGYGRGCVMCHAPHSGSAGNGVSKGDAYSGNYALWGQDLTPLYGQVLQFGDGSTVAPVGGTLPVGSTPGSYQVTLPAAGTITSAHDANTVILFCLSCHDGNLAKVGMMKGKTVETLPIVGGNAPTLLGNDGSVAGNYNNDHPVGASALVSCTGAYNWDCAGGGAVAITMTGPNSSQFVKNYGFAVSFATIGTNVNAVTCTSCHNQHSQNVYSGTMTGVKGNYQTAFFLNGYYNPSTGGNSTAQFCRQCHGGESNESHGQYLVSTN
jgi:hypothetical protein